MFKETKRSYFKKKLNEFRENIDVSNLEKDKLIRIESEIVSKKRVVALIIFGIILLISVLYFARETIIYGKIIFKYTQQEIIEFRHTKVPNEEINVFRVLMISFYFFIVVGEIIVILIIWDFLFNIKKFFVYKEKILININRKKTEFYINDINTETEFIKEVNYSIKELGSLKDAVEELLKNEEKDRAKYKNIIFNIAKIIFSAGVLVGIYRITLHFSEEIIAIFNLSEKLKIACLKLDLFIVIAIIAIILMIIGFVPVFVNLRKYKKEFYRKRIRILRRIISEIEIEKGILNRDRNNRFLYFLN
ncbi:hypothetical protein [Clostridium thermobutyricum]|uniref:hypothetical protein n=1 Tax=Clostridium thermobutyricum TaxID=29372 RepID=UPI003F5244A0